MGHQARKRFGQHFLTATDVISDIVHAVAANPDDTLVEIGPGRGALTIPLANTGAELHAIEFDRDLAAPLRSRLATAANVTIHEFDALKFDYASLGSDLRIVSNLPYNISTPLLFRLFQYNRLFHDLIFMLQLEVVNRITAEPGSRDYGRLTIMSSYFCEAEKLFEVPPEAFTPMPKVNSAIVRLVPKHDRVDEVKDIKVLQQLLITAFSKRRKTVRNALRSYLTADDLDQLNIDPGLRPENLRPEEYFRCANYITDNLSA